MSQGSERLLSGNSIIRLLREGGPHSYWIVVSAAQLVIVEIEQLGIDVATELFAPDGTSIIAVDSPTGRRGTEVLVAVTETSGEHRLEIRAVETGAHDGEYRVQLGVRTATPEDREHARAELLFAQAENLRREGGKASYHNALQLYRETQPIWRALNIRRREADTLYRLGWVHTDLSELRTAREKLDEARAIYADLGDQLGEGIVLNRRGMVRWRLGETEGALADVEEGLKRYREVDDPSRTVDALNNLGILHRRLGATEKALEFYGEARLLYRELADPRREARTLGNLGVLLLQQGRLAEAADHFEATQVLWQDKGSARGEAFAWNSLGEVRKRQERFDDAMECFDKALVLRREAEDHLGEATTFTSVGTTHLLRGKLAKARKAYERALDFYEEAGDPLREAILRLNLARLEILAGSPSEALVQHERTAQLLAEAPDRQLEASNLYGIARALHDMGEFAMARARLENTLERTEDLRIQTASEAFRIAFFATKQHYYELYMDVLHHLEEEEPDGDYATRAFETNERRRARALLDLLGESAAEIRRFAAPELLLREREIQQQLEALEQHRSSLLRTRNRDSEAISEIEEGQREMRLRLDEARSEMRRKFPQYAALTQPQPVTVEEVQDYLLNHRTLLLSYALGEERSFLWLVSRDAVSSYPLPGREEIERAAHDTHQLLTETRKSAKANLERHLERLGETLLGPIATQLKDGKRLLIVAEGELLTVPFSALTKPGEGKALVEDHEVVHLPSASVLMALRREAAMRIPAPHQLLIYAAPEFATHREGAEKSAQDELRQAAADFGIEDFSPLEYADEEAKAILEVARGETLSRLGPEASKRRLRSDKLGDYQILHFATHGLIHSTQPELSGLALSDGFLRLHEVYNLDLNAELVVLSACRTGLGPNFRGEGLLGLARGFLYAGAPRVLVSLWNVSDRGTTELMKRFYWALLETGAPPALALRAAQLSMKEEEDWHHPYYWAPFTFVGDWRRPGEADVPIEEDDGGGEVDDVADVDYPGPDPDWCDELPEPWMQRLCKKLRELRISRSPIVPPGQNAFNGIDALSGGDLHENLSDRQLASRVRWDQGDLSDRERQLIQEMLGSRDPHRGPAEGVDPMNLASSGWGVIFPAGSPKVAAIRDALSPLLTHRREQAAEKCSKYYRDDLEYLPGEDKDAFLRRYYAASWGPADPKQFPYYLLIIGGLDEIPYSFQSLLDVQYAVGRLDFDDIENYARYAESVVAVEQAKDRDDVHVLPGMEFFSVVHDGDQATQLAAERLIEPLRRSLSRDRGEWSVKLRSKGGKGDLKRLLGGSETPALLFTAAHGLGYRSGHHMQAQNQGAILCQEWPGRGKLEPEYFFSADDVSDDARVQGLITFLFGCYSAGTPHMDNLPPAPMRNPIERAPRPFLSPLANRLLSHPNGSALAVLGHVDRTWTRSFGADRGLGYLHILSLLKRLLDGYPVGFAMDWMHERFAEIATVITQARNAYGRAVGTPSEAVEAGRLDGLWRAHNDARNFVVLGDPAVRLAAGPRAALLGMELSPERAGGGISQAGQLIPSKLVPLLRTRGAVALSVTPEDAVHNQRKRAK